MNVSEAIWQRIAQEVDTVFYLPGGGCGPLVDALGQSGLRAISCLHEQGAGFAALAYAQYKGFGVCLVTSGPGATNAVTPCLAAWVDSVPMLFISGQVMVKWLAYGDMRCRGTQEAPTMDIVESITKYSYQIVSPEITLEVLEELIHRARSDRPGPVWLDMTMDIQAAEL